MESGRRDARISPPTGAGGYQMNIAVVHSYLENNQIFLFMASASFSIDGASNALQDLGFICEKDPVVGARVAEMREKGISFLSMDGLEFCRLNILNEEVSA